MFSGLGLEGGGLIQAHRGGTEKEVESTLSHIYL